MPTLILAAATEGGACAQVLSSHTQQQQQRRRGLYSTAHLIRLFTQAARRRAASERQQLPAHLLVGSSCSRGSGTQQRSSACSSTCKQRPSWCGAAPDASPPAASGAAWSPAAAASWGATWRSSCWTGGGRRGPGVGMVDGASCCSLYGGTRRVLCPCSPCAPPPRPRPLPTIVLPPTAAAHGR